MKLTFLIFLSLCFLNACTKRAEMAGVFTKVTHKTSKVTFTNEINDSDSLNIMDYLYFYNGGGVASADFNNDGLEDLYFISNQSSNKLYLNRGSLKFEDITEQAGVSGSGNWKTGVTVVDINSDGFKDIYVCVVSGYKMFKGKNQLYINNGDLTFTENAKDWGLDFEGLSTQASFFDYDKDGDLDLFLLTHSVHNNDSYGDSSARSKYSHAAGDHLLVNQGDHFIDRTAESGIYASPIGYGLGVSVADLNNDGWDDIYVSNDFFEQDYYYINQQNGTFKENLTTTFGHTSLFSMGNTVGDINKDGYLDVITTDMLPDDMKALKSTINDEALDVYNLRVKSGFHYQYSRNTLQLNVANGRKFIDIGLYAGISATDWTWSPLMQDFNMDGIKDLFFSNGIKNRLTDMDYLKYLGMPQVAKVGTERAYDLEKIKEMPDGRLNDFLYFGDSLLRFKDVSAINGMNIVSCSSGAIAVDLDNDGDLEIVTNNMNDAASIYKNRTIENAGKKLRFISYSVKFKEGNRDGIGTKLFLKTDRGVDQQDIQTSNAFQSNKSDRLLFTLAENEVPRELLVVWPDNTFQLLKQFKLGTKNEITFQKSEVQASRDLSKIIEEFIKDRKQFRHKEVQANLIAELKTTGVPDFNYNGLLPHSYLPATPPVAVGDVNGDGLDDVYVGGIIGEEKYLLIADKKGDYKKTLVDGLSRHKSYSDKQAEWVDVDKDGDLDLFVLSGNHPFTENHKLVQPRLYLNNGNLNFSSVDFPTVDTPVSKVFFADFNGDKLPEVIITGGVSFFNYTTSLPSYLFTNRGKGQYEQAPDDMFSEVSKISFIQDIDVIDLNEDGRKDMIIAAEWQPIYVFLNDGRKLRKQNTPGPDKLQGWWQSVSVGDYDSDGKPDLIAGNWGANNKFNVSKESPLLAYNQDFDQNGRNDLILSYAHKGRYYPFRQKSDLDMEVPFLKKEWLSYAKMADKTTPEIFDVDQNEPDLSVNYFKSVIIRDILGRQQVQELPFAYQQSPIRSVSGGFLNAGKEIVINGNFWGVIPYEGKYDALGIASAHFESNGTLSPPTYWINPLLNFQEITHIEPLRSDGRDSWLVLTSQGKLFVVSDKKRKK